MFLPKNGIANYADDNTPYSTGTGIHNITSDLEQASDILSKWFQDNYLKANPDKYHVLLSETSETQLIVKNVPIASSCCEKLLGIKIDHKLSFEPHVESLCKKASQKLNALARLTSSLKFKQRKLLLNAFITAQFSYAPEFGAAFQEIGKNVVLLTNLKQKLNFGIQKTAHANFAKITSIK